MSKYCLRWTIFFSFKNNYKIGIDVVGGFPFCIVCGGVCLFAFFFVFVF